MGRLANEAILRKIFNETYCYSSFDECVENIVSTVDAYIEKQKFNNKKTAAKFLLKNLDHIQQGTIT